MFDCAHPPRLSAFRLPPSAFCFLLSGGPEARSGPEIRKNLHYCPRDDTNCPHYGLTRCEVEGKINKNWEMPTTRGEKWLASPFLHFLWSASFHFRGRYQNRGCVGVVGWAARVLFWDRSPKSSVFSPRSRVPCSRFRRFLFPACPVGASLFLLPVPGSMFHVPCSRFRCFLFPACRVGAILKYILSP